MSNVDKSAGLALSTGEEPPWSKWFPVFVLAYFGAQFILHMATATSLGFDDAEQAVMGQVFDWGYGPQLPLFTWIYRFLNQFITDPILITSLMRNGLLATSVLSVYWLTRSFVPAYLAAFAAMSVILVPQLAWQGQHGHTHTNVAVASVALTLVCYYRFAVRPGFVRACLLALIIALGIFSKYNYYLVLFGIALSTILVPAIRQSFSLKWVVLIVVLVCILISPGVYWMAQNHDLMLSRISKFQMQRGFLGTRLIGVYSLTVATIFLTGIMAATYTVMLRLWKRAPSPLAGVDYRDWRRFFWTLIAVCWVATLAIVLFTGTTHVKDTWLEPLFWYLPIPLVLTFANRVGSRELNAMGLLVAGLAGLILLLGALQTVFPRVAGTAIKDFPYGEIAEALEKEGFQARTILVSDMAIAGNLPTHIDGLVVITPEYRRLAVKTDEPIALVWKGVDDTSDNLDWLFRDRFGREPVRGNSGNVTVALPDGRDLSVSFTEVE